MKLHRNILIISLLLTSFKLFSQQESSISTTCGIDQSTPITISLNSKSPEEVSKTIIFAQPFNPADEISLRVDSENRGIFSTTALFYKGDSLVHSIHPLKSGSQYLSIAKVFDRVRILLKATTTNPSGQASIYTVKRIVGKPTPVTQDLVACDGEPFTLIVNNPNNDLVFSWYGPDKKPLSNNTSSLTASLPAGNYTFRVSAYYSKCAMYRSGEEEIRVKVVEKGKVRVSWE
jgi:hypothetical protein